MCLVFITASAELFMWAWQRAGWDTNKWERNNKVIIIQMLTKLVTS